MLEICKNTINTSIISPFSVTLQNFSARGTAFDWGATLDFLSKIRRNAKVLLSTGKAICVAGEDAHAYNACYL